MTLIKRMYEWVDSRVGIGEIIEKQMTGYLLPRNINAWFSLGNAYFKEGHYKEAIDNFRRALELKPEDTSLYRSLAELAERQGRKDQVAEVLRGRTVADGVRMLIVPGSVRVRLEAEAEGAGEQEEAEGHRALKRSAWRRRPLGYTSLNSGL